MFVMETVDDLWNHIAYVQAYSPDRFPHRDFLPPDGQMTFDTAFAQLREGVQIAYPEEEFTAKRANLNTLLDRSYLAYLSGDEVLGHTLLDDFQSRIFKG